jgi:peptidoglycan/LPS O-acetylase OafA/YrhL
MLARLKSIDALRGGAALAVVLHHAVNAGARPTARWFPALEQVAALGSLGVPLFFVISGFCIHARWASQRATGAEPRLEFLPFWKRRLWRLYPPYLVALVLSMALVFLAYLSGRDLPILGPYPAPRGRWIGADFFAHVTMLHGFVPRLDRAGGNAPFWTLAREEYFYLLYFPLLALRRRVGLKATVAAVGALGLASVLLLAPYTAPDPYARGLVQSSALALWIQWCLGMISVEAWYGLVKLPAWCRSLPMGVAWAVLAFFAQHRFEPLMPILLGMAFFTWVNAALFYEREGSWPASRGVRWLEGVGLFSYSLYLIHHPIRGILKHALAPLVTSANPGLYALGTALVVVVCFYSGKVFFWAVERRFLAPREESRALNMLGPRTEASQAVTGGGA